MCSVWMLYCGIMVDRHRAEVVKSFMDLKPNEVYLVEQINSNPIHQCQSDVNRVSSWSDAEEK